MIQRVNIFFKDAEIDDCVFLRMRGKGEPLIIWATIEKIVQTIPRKMRHTKAMLIRGSPGNKQKLLKNMVCTYFHRS